MYGLIYETKRATNTTLWHPYGAEGENTIFRAAVADRLVNTFRSPNAVSVLK